jgi:hypothetical protein
MQQSSCLLLQVKCAVSWECHVSPSQRLSRPRLLCYLQSKRKTVID